MKLVLGIVLGVALLFWVQQASYNSGYADGLRHAYFDCDYGDTK